MQRDEILAIVTRHVSEVVEGLQPADIDPARSMTDHGLSSLDITDAVLRSMRELKVKIPRSGLRNLHTINDLVDVLQQATGAG